MYRLRKLLGPSLIAMSLLLVTFGIAYGVHITVDGDPSDWPAPGSQVSKTTDPQESAIPDDTNISAAWFTADTIRVFGRIDTYTTTRWTPVTIPFSPFVVYCLNTDNNTATGLTVGLCRNMAGVDYEFQIVGNNGSPTISLLKCSNVSCTSQPGTLSVASQNNVTEFGALLSDVGIDGVNCTPSSTIPVAVYFDNADYPLDDNVPDSGTATITLSCPTAVRLLSTSVTAHQSFPFLPLFSMMLGIIGFAIGVCANGQRHAK